MSKIANLRSNIIYGYLSTVSLVLLNFISRTIFLYTLNENYLGVYSLFSSVIGVLSFADLGIGVAMNFALYKPVAENNTELIKSLIKFYKKIFMFIMIIIFVCGLCFIPFINFFITTKSYLGPIKLYFFIFLINTCVSYLVSYKFTLVNAYQKEYLIKKISIIVDFSATIINIIVLITTHSFLYYLLSILIINIIKNMYLSKSVDDLFPLLKDKNVNEIDVKEVNSIKKNVTALMFHKVGDIAIYQTDNFIISKFIDIGTVGIFSNYTLIKNSLNSLVNIIFTSSISTIGNILASNDDYQSLKIFKIFNFVNFWIYGYISISMLLLFTPFITLWIGSNKTIGLSILFVFCLDNYILGQRSAYLNFKTAFGQFNDDKYVVIISAIINLVISIIAVNQLGLLGVVMGTLFAGIFEGIVRPIISYKKITGENVVYYFLNIIKYFSITVIALFLSYFFTRNLLVYNIGDFLFKSVIIFLIVNITFVFFTFKSKEYTNAKKLIFKMRRN